MEPATQVSGSGDKGGGVAIGMMMPPDPEWSEDVKKLGDRIANLTLIQCVQLSQYLEEVHGIKCSNGVPQRPWSDPQHMPPQDQVPEQTEWAVIYDGFEADKKLGVIKLIREMTSMGIKEAKDFVETASGKPIREGLAHGEATILKTKLEAAGCKISLK